MQKIINTRQLFKFLLEDQDRNKKDTLSFLTQNTKGLEIIDRELYKDDFSPDAVLIEAINSIKCKTNTTVMSRYLSELYKIRRDISKVGVEEAVHFDSVLFWKFVEKFKNFKSLSRLDVCNVVDETLRPFNESFDDKFIKSINYEYNCIDARKFFTDG